MTSSDQGLTIVCVCVKGRPDICKYLTLLCQLWSLTHTRTHTETPIKPSQFQRNPVSSRVLIKPLGLARGKTRGLQQYTF